MPLAIDFAPVAHNIWFMAVYRVRIVALFGCCSLILVSAAADQQNDSLPPKDSLRIQQQLDELKQAIADHLRKKHARD